MAQWKNTSAIYGLTARTLHWVMAAIILGLLAMGFIMVDMPFSPFKLDLYMWHKSFGLLILLFVIFRLGVRFTQPHPAHMPTHQSWERALAGLIHGAFYISFIGMPISGWVMSSAGEYPVNFFGLFELPALSEKNEHLYELTKQAHEIFAFIFIGGIGLHVLGAVKHHILDKDETLKRMGGNLGIAGLGLLALLIPTYSCIHV